MSLNNRKRLLTFSGLILLGGGSSLPFIRNNSNLFYNTFNSQGGGSSLAYYPSFCNKNTKNLYLNSSSLRPSQALEEVKNLTNQNFEIQLNNQNSSNLNFSNISNSNEKEAITKIYEEINKESKVLKIEKQKDEQYKELESDLKNHKSNYSNFVNQNVSTTIESIKKRKRRNTPQARSSENQWEKYALDVRYGEFENLENIKPINIQNKKAVLEFYKSYVKALKQQKELFEQLKKVDGNIQNKSNKEVDKFQKNVDYFNKFNSNDSTFSIINLSEDQRVDDNLPKDLLSDVLQKSIKERFQGWEKEVKGLEEGVELQICKFTSSLWTYISGQNPCYNTINWIKGDLKTIKEATEFKILLQLLRDMGQSVPEMNLECIGEKQYTWKFVFWEEYQDKRCYFLLKN